MTDPRMLRLLALTNELHAIVAELGVSISLHGHAYGGRGDASISVHDIIPPGMTAADFVWSDINDRLIVGKHMAGETRVTVYLDANQRHLTEAVPA